MCRLIVIVIVLLLIIHWMHPEWLPRVWHREGYYASQEVGREFNWEADNLGISHTLRANRVSC